MDIIKKLSQELSIGINQVENAVKLIDEGNTVAFISRYRKEATGSLDDNQMRELFTRLNYLRSFEERKEEIIRLIDNQGKLTDEIIEALDKAEKLTELEDIYRPYKQKKRTRASIAKEKGLEPLADTIFEQITECGSLDDIAKEYIDSEKGVETVEDALNGASDIIAENISNNAEYRKYIREKTMATGIMDVCAKDNEKESVYEMYYEFSQALTKIADHRILAINRGEKEDFLNVTITADQDAFTDYIASDIIRDSGSVFAPFIKAAAEDSFKRLIWPSIEREIRNELTDRASDSAIKLFSKNLKALLMQPPIKGKTVLGIDPGYRTGCKVAVIDHTGKVLDTGIIYCTLPNHDKDKSEKFVLSLIAKYDIDIIAIGNGTASKESEIFVSNLIKKCEKKLYYIMVNEAGASVYSASKEGAEEFPDFTVEQRSAVSIARRMQDPLVELVKIDPKSIGVGQYQHDMNQTQLHDALGGVVEDCVNNVGVDLNTASGVLLSYVSGISTTVAKNIVSYREQNGIFTSRKELLKVDKLGPKAFTQCAGFLKIPESKNVLDNTSVHPESYQAALKLLETLGYTEKDVSDKKLMDIDNRLKCINLDQFSQENNIGKITLTDIIEALKKPGRDPREDMPSPILMENVMGMEDLTPGMIMEGTVRNVIDFGAFVDIGVHQDGLVHISEISNKYIKHPTDVLSVGDVVKVKVISVDVAKKRISLSMKDVQ
ncbi:MAG: RNA-binding transcriptional accessory protein [Ruminococcaceae bacterium]|nr:RNA-binding transcriptional accessory protein [Oscillospiraceae bacterium]